MPRKLWLLTVFLATLAAFPVMAAPQKPPELGSVIHSALPYGTGTYSFLLAKVYDAALWTDASVWSMDAPFALSLTYAMHFTSQDIVQCSIDEMQKQQPLSNVERKNYSEVLAQVIPEVHAGDTLTDLYIPGKGSVFYFNGHETGHISSEAFSRRFLEIWFSQKTSAPKLRGALLKVN